MLGAQPTKTVPPPDWETLDQFDSAWRLGPPPRIGDYLPPDGPSRRHLLAELVKIDLEYRWRQSEADNTDSPGDLPPRPTLDHYARTFSELGSSLDWPTELIGEEYRARRLWGDRPSHETFFNRFPDRRAAIRAELSRIDAELDAEGLPSATHGAPLPRPATIPCPQCHVRFARDGQEPGALLACPACSSRFTIDATRSEATQTTKPAPVVGRYEIRDLLGVGAFGAVWRAWDPELAREVAVKLLRGGALSSPAEGERFLREARAVAHLRHPRIVPVHDVGRDGDSVYLVSELVRGTSLAELLARSRPGPRAAAALAADVADALEHAHRQGIVHRDLKPSNLILEAAPVAASTPSDPWSARPLLLDFGLAKRDAGEVTMTLDGQILGTPAYMSPEQTRDPHAVDGRADVYSLGVILYQMLTGELPFRGTARMVLHQVLHDDPRPPRRLSDSIPRDLETITLRCLAKDPSGRYATAAELAADLRRFLTGDPIIARPPGPLARLARRARRHPAITALALALATAIAGGFGGILWQWSRAEANLAASRRHARRAEENLQDALRAVEQLTHTSEVDLANAEGMQPLRRKLLGTARDYYEGFAKRRGDDPTLLSELADARLRAATLTEQIGSRSEARAAHEQARDAYARLVREHPGVASYEERLAGVEHNLGALALATGRFPDAERSYGEALELRTRLVRSHPGDLTYHQQLAATRSDLAVLMGRSGRKPEAERLYRMAVADLEPLQRAHPDDPALARALARCRINYGELFRTTGRREEAEVSYRAAIALLEPLTRSQPDVVTHRRELAASYNNLAIVSTARTEKIAWYRRAIAIQEPLAGANPAVLTFSLELGRSYNNIGSALRDQGDRDQAETFFQKALAIRERLARDHPSVVDIQRELAVTRKTLADLRRGKESTRGNDSPRGDKERQGSTK